MIVKKMADTRSRTLIILNPHAAGGRAGKVWKDLEPLLWQELGELMVAVTQHPAEVAEHLDKAHAVGIRRVVSIGGDGTNHALVNALAGQNETLAPEDRMIYGTLPVGTGRDWARGAGIPTRDLKQAAEWIARAQPKPLDLGKVEAGSHAEYFLNIASAGLGGEVAKRVNRQSTRRPWTFLGATVQTILQYRPGPMTVKLDGENWYDGGAFALVVANGTTFGHGMKIAPNAHPDDGLFDVVLVKNASRATILTALRRVYSATHLTHPAVQHARAQQVEVQSADKLGMELDGEPMDGQSITFLVQPGILNVLM